VYGANVAVIILAVWSCIV